MNEKTAILNVRMLGDFSITYDGRQVSFGKNTTTKAMKLLQILIYYGEQGIAREKLLNALYVREELADAANNLRVTAHRLKKMIIDAGLPEYDYIVIKKGVYRWNAPVPTVVDARKFQELYEEAQNCADTKQKEELLKQVCNMYRGEFLPEISGDEWVLLESVQYKKLYSNALKELCDGLIEKCDYEEALLFCEPACRLYPFDEWQSIKIECFLGMKRYKEAMKEYDDTAKLFFEELGISPSERLMEQFDQMSSQLKHVKPKEIQDIKQRLKEEKGQGGAYYCSLPSFREQLPSGDTYAGAKRSVRISDAVQPDRRQRTSAGKTGEAGAPVRRITEYDPALPAKRRFLYQIQSFTVSGTSDRNEQRELWTDI